MGGGLAILRNANRARCNMSLKECEKLVNLFTWSRPVFGLFILFIFLSGIVIEGLSCVLVGCRVAHPSRTSGSKFESIYFFIFTIFSLLVGFM